MRTTRRPSAPVRPTPVPEIDTEAPETAAFVRTSLTQARLRLVVMEVYADSLVTCRTACRAMPAWVTVTTYQPAGNADGRRIQPRHSSSG